MFYSRSKQDKGVYWIKKKKFFLDKDNALLCIKRDVCVCPFVCGFTFSAQPLLQTSFNE